MAIQTALELLATRNNDGRSALELALDNYELYYKANQALSQNKEYEINNGQNSKRRLTRADAKEVEQNMLFWENQIAKEQGAALTTPKIRTIFTAGIPQ